MNQQHDVDRGDRCPAGGGHRARLLGGLPVTERRLWVAGVSTLILEGGSGSPLVLLHGEVASGGVVWGPVLAQLARGHRLVIPDIPGLGESVPVARLDAAFDTWLARLVGLTCKERPTLVAHSLSGGLAARFAVRYGDLLDRLVIYASPAVGPYRIGLGLRLAAIRLSQRPSARNTKPFWSFRDLDKTRRQDRAWYEAFDRYSRSRESDPQVKRTMRQLLESPAGQLPDADLERITVPTSLLWGRHDRMVPLRVGEAASSRFGWPLRVIDDAGHVPHIDRPEAFRRALSEIEPPVGKRNGVVRPVLYTELPTSGDAADLHRSPDAETSYRS